MKCNQARPGFELVSSCPHPATITITPRAPPKSLIKCIFSFSHWNNPSLWWNLIHLTVTVVSSYPPRLWSDGYCHNQWPLPPPLKHISLSLFFISFSVTFLSAPSSVYFYLYFIHLFPPMLNFRKNLFHSEEVLSLIKNEIWLLNPLSVLGLSTFSLIFLILSDLPKFTISPYIYRERDGGDR